MNLKDLKKVVESLIDAHGEEGPCAWLVFTPEDVEDVHGDLDPDVVKQILFDLTLAMENMVPDLYETMQLLPGRSFAEMSKYILNARASHQS